MSEAGPKTYELTTDAEAGIRAAAEAVAAGRCIVVPTDTVYGIGSDPFSKPAVRRLLRSKRRGTDMPPPVLIAEPAMLRALAGDVPKAATALAKRHWPGALTLVLKAQRSLGMELGDTHGTVAVRVPDHDQLRELLRHTGPLAVSSANLSGKPPAETCQAAHEQLGAKVEVYLDGGATPGPGASTIIDFASTDTGRVLRQGLIPFEVLKEDAPDLEPVAEPEGEPELEGPSKARPALEALEPGQAVESASSPDETAAAAAIAEPGTQPEAAEPAIREHPQTERTDAERPDEAEQPRGAGQRQPAPSSSEPAG